MCRICQVMLLIFIYQHLPAILASFHEIFAFSFPTYECIFRENENMYILNRFLYSTVP